MLFSRRTIRRCPARLTYCNPYRAPIVAAEPAATPIPKCFQKCLLRPIHASSRLDPDGWCRVSFATASNWSQSAASRLSKLRVFPRRSRMQLRIAHRTSVLEDVHVKDPHRNLWLALQALVRSFLRKEYSRSEDAVVLFPVL